MKRRKALRYIFITGCAVWVLPSCTNRPGNAPGFLNTSQQKLLEDLSETIIPAGATPGAKELGVHHFIIKMMEDCRSPENQKVFKSGLEKFEGFVKDQKGMGWNKLSASEKQRTLKDIVNSENTDKDIKASIKSVREPTITGYKNSKYYLTKVQEYQLVPRHFYGCVKVKSSKI